MMYLAQVTTACTLQANACGSFQTLRRFICSSLPTVLASDAALPLDTTPPQETTPGDKKAKRTGQVYHQGALDTTHLDRYTFKQYKNGITRGPHKSSVGGFRHRTSWRTTTTLNRDRAPHGRFIAVDRTRLWPRRSPTQSADASLVMSGLIPHPFSDYSCCTCASSSDSSAR